MPDLPGVLARAKSAGVEGMSCCGTSEKDWPAVASLVERDPRIVPSFGIHPWYVMETTDSWPDILKAVLGRIPAAGVGEIGLDHAVDPQSFERQETIFRRQLALAREMNRPVTIHCRKAWKVLIGILEHTTLPAAGGLIHSYSGAPDLIPQLAKFGLYFSFSGSITRSHNKRGHRSAAAVPSDRLLVETDSPDIMPAGAPGERNEPSFIPLVADALAGIRGTDVDELIKLTYENTRRLFSSRR